MSLAVEFSRLISATPETVFDAFTDPEGQKAFYDQDDPGRIVESRCDLRVGGVWTVEFGPSRRELYRHRHVFEAIERPRRLVLASTETRLDGSSFHTRLEFRFADNDGQTLMTMIQRGFPTAELRNEHTRGVPGAFARLENLVRARGRSIVTVESPEYDRVRRPAFARFSAIRPHAIVRCRDERDVALALSMARRQGLDLAVRSGGHCFAGRSSTPGVVIDVGPINQVSVAEGTVEVGAGARLEHIYDALDQHGLTIAAGCGPTVGIAGLALGGGLGILGRKYGLTCDQLLGARVVLADGRVVECDERRHEDLFWALRGAGGGQFGVVTRLRLKTLSVADATCFDLTWPIGRAPDVARAWQTWAPRAPEEIAASLLAIAPRDLDRPAAVHLFGASLGARAEAEERLEPLLGAIAADPAQKRLTHLPYGEVKRWLADHGPGEEAGGEDPGRKVANAADPDAADPGGGNPGGADPSGADAEPSASDLHSFSRSDFFARRLPDETIPALFDHLAQARVEGQARTLDFTPWGGAYNRMPVSATAFAHRSAEVLLKHEVAIPASRSAEQTEAATRWLSRSWSLVHPFGTGGVYPNFPDPDLDEWAVAYHGANLPRLRAVKARYDPDDVFSFHQSIPPARADAR